MCTVCVLSHLLDYLDSIRRFAQVLQQELRPVKTAERYQTSGQLHQIVILNNAQIMLDNNARIMLD